MGAIACNPKTYYTICSIRRLEGEDCCEEEYQGAEAQGWHAELSGVTRVTVMEMVQTCGGERTHCRRHKVMRLEHAWRASGITGSQCDLDSVSEEEVVGKTLEILVDWCRTHISLGEQRVSDLSPHLTLAAAVTVVVGM